MTQSSKPDGVKEDLTGPMRELREYARGSLDVDHSDVNRIAGLVDDPKVLEFLIFGAQEYEPVGDMPTSFFDTRFAEQIIELHATQKANSAIKRGDQSSAAYLTGVPSYERDISGLQSTNRLRDWLVNSEQCKVIYCAATMGRGKTDWSLLLLELIEHQYRQAKEMQDAENVPTPEFATNFNVNTPDYIDAEVNEFHNYDNFLEWAEDGSSDDVRWFVFDEASTELTAQSGANAQKVAEVFAPFVRKMRKSGINMITIGHDKADVHPAIRAVASYIHKPSTKVGEIYEGVKDPDPCAHKLTRDGIPQTSWHYNTDDVAEWDWGSQVEDGPDVDELDESEDHISKDEWQQQRNDWMKSMYEAGMSYEDVGEVFGISGEGARKAIKRFDESAFDGTPANLNDSEAIAALVEKYISHSELESEDVHTDHFPSEAPADD
jgi:hypothetical protein